MHGPLVCGETLAFHSDGVSLVAGSYRNDDCLEVYDLRKMDRGSVISFDTNQKLRETMPLLDYY